MSPAQKLALEIVMHLDALSNDELLAIEDAIVAEKKRRQALPKSSDAHTTIGERHDEERITVSRKS